MKIVVCYKNVPEEQDIVVKADYTLDLSAAPWKISEYDLNAIQAAVDLATEEDEVIALTVGGTYIKDSKMRKAVLSRGPDKMVGIQDDTLNGADTFTVASLIKATVEKIGGVDLVLFGEGSGDLYAQQTGSVTGALLGWATVNSVQSIALSDGALEVSRSVEDGAEWLDVTLPAVLSVTSDINSPTIPGLKDILAGGKKPSEIWTLADVGAVQKGTTQVLSILAPKQSERKHIILVEESEDNIEMLYQYLLKLI